MYDYSIGLYEKAVPDKLSIEEKMLIAKKAGFDFLEFCIDLNPERELRLEWPKLQRKKLVDFMLENDIHLTTMSLSLLRKYPLGALDRSVNAKSLEIIKKGVELACDLGVQIVLFNGYDVYNTPSTEETSARFAENLPEAVKIAAKRGIILGIENADKEFADSIAKVAYWIDRINSPFLRIYGDIANTANAFGGEIDNCIQDLEQGRGRIVAIHLKDSMPNEYRFTPFGEGYVDFGRSIEKLKNMEVRIFIAELFYREGNDYLAEVAKVNKFLRSFF
jgi:L-ribulose-5-phosphate 3-epimerase